MGTQTYDAIVVGSGMSGGWAAKELCEKGLKTLVLERGQQLRHVTDYTTALKDPWQLPHNNRATNADKAAQPIQSTLYLYDQSTKGMFVDDNRYHYEQAKPFNWYRGYHVGGRSLMWSRHVFRFSDLDCGGVHSSDSVCQCARAAGRFGRRSRQADAAAVQP